MQTAICEIHHCSSKNDHGDETDKQSSKQTNKQTAWTIDKINNSNNNSNSSNNNAYDGCSKTTAFCGRSVH